MANTKLIQADVRKYLNENWTCFRDPEIPHRTFAQVTDGENRYVFVLESELAREFLARKFIGKYDGLTPTSGVFRDALDALVVRAKFATTTHRTANRVAESGGKVYLDLANQRGEIVEVDATGWRVVTDAPVKFIRIGGMKPLPMPSVEGDPSQIWKFVNVPEQENRVLFAAWLLKTLYPVGPTPLLFLSGEAGSAKSTLAAVISDLVDPRTTPTRSMPRNERDLVLNATGSWVLCFDNLSGLTDTMSDALCRLCTGSGYFFPSASLADGGGEAVFVRRPVVLNSIDDVALHGDLLDRTVCLTLPRISDADRRTEQEFWAAFRRAVPSILGGLLDALSRTLAALPTSAVAGKPRMADFAALAVAGEAHLGFGAGSFVKAYQDNRSKADELVVESSGVGAAVQAMMMSLIPDRWEGTAATLLEVLTSEFGVHMTRRGAVPETPRKLSGLLRRVAPNLRRVGFDVTFEQRTADERLIAIARTRQLTETETGYLRFEIYGKGQLRKPDRKRSPDPEALSGEEIKALMRDDGRDGRDGESDRPADLIDMMQGVNESEPQNSTKRQKKAKEKAA